MIQVKERARHRLRWLHKEALTYKHILVSTAGKKLSDKASRTVEIEPQAACVRSYAHLERLCTCSKLPTLYRHILKANREMLELSARLGFIKSGGDGELI